MSFGVCFGQFGAEVIGWVRSGYHNKGVGELGLAYAEQIAFARKNFNFMALHISQKNKASRRVAEKAGFRKSPLVKVKFLEFANLARFQARPVEKLSIALT